MSDDLAYTDDERAYWHGRHHDRSLDLGHGVRAEFFGIYGDDTDARAGLVISHIHDDEMVCEGSVTFDIPQTREKVNGPKWQVQSLEPLTISPSVLVRPCGLHGFIRDGRWVPA